ncbi:MAG: hypothetical protein WKF75_21815 [Singulisphaera sp.]
MTNWTALAKSPEVPDGGERSRADRTHVIMHVGQFVAAPHGTSPST